MKTKVLTLLLLSAFAVSAPAAKPKKGGGKPAPAAPAQEQPAPPLPAAPADAAQLPSVPLNQFLSARLDQILAPLDQKVTLPRTDLMQLREAMVDRTAKAPQPEKAPPQMAVAVCDALSSAMDEREKTVAAFQTASHAPGIQDVHDNIERLPRHGRGSGKAAQAGVRQEQSENKEHASAAAQKGSFLSSNYPKQWADRGTVLRQNIQQLLTREREAERALAQAKPAAPAPAAATP